MDDRTHVFHSARSRSVRSSELAIAADCSPSHQLAVLANFSRSCETSPIRGCASKAILHSSVESSLCQMRLDAAIIAPWL